MVNQEYYEMLGGFSYLLGELKKKFRRMCWAMTRWPCAANYAANTREFPKKKRGIPKG